MTPTFTAAELAACAEREVKQRKRLYPHWVADGRMKKEFADEQIAMMGAIAAHFRAEVAKNPQASGALL